MSKMDMFQRERCGRHKREGKEKQTIVSSLAAHTPAPGFHRGVSTRRICALSTGCLLKRMTAFPRSKKATGTLLPLWFARGPPQEDEDHTRCRQSQP
jgi:hypothetical protein